MLQIYTKESMHGVHIYCIFIAYSRARSCVCEFDARVSHPQLNRVGCLTGTLVLLFYIYAHTPYLALCVSRARVRLTQNTAQHTRWLFFFLLHTLLRLNHTDFKQLTFNSGNERTRISFSVCFCFAYFFMCYDFDFLFFGPKQINGPSAQSSSVCLAAV